MKTGEILGWLHSHRESVGGDPESILQRAEKEARGHAAEQAWLHAKKIVEREMADWKSRSEGSHAAEDCVAREFCHDLARALRHLEPHPEGDEAAFVDPATLAAFATEARTPLRLWLDDIAGDEERRVWSEVIRFTKRRAKSLIREGTVSTASGWDETHSYTETAVRLAAILARDYEEHARRAS